CLTPDDQPGDQKDQREKNGRDDSQPACELAPLDLRKISVWKDMRRVSFAQTIKRKNSRDHAAINQNVRNACHCRNNIKEEVLLFGRQRITSLRRGAGDDGVAGEEKRLGSHQPGESLYDENVFVLDLIPNGSIPIGGAKQIGCWGLHE